MKPAMRIGPLVLVGVALLASALHAYEQRKNADLDTDGCCRRRSLYPYRQPVPSFEVG